MVERTSPLLEGLVQGLSANSFHYDCRLQRSRRVYTSLLTCPPLVPSKLYEKTKQIGLVRLFFRSERSSIFKITSRNNLWLKVLLFIPLEMWCAVLW